MVDRVRISSDVFKISRPGFDVDTASNEQLAFDGFAGKYNGIYMSGRVPYSPSTWTETFYSEQPFYFGGAYYRRTFTIPFGRTFNQPPQLIYALRVVTETALTCKPRYSYVYVDPTSFAFYGVVVSAATTTSDVTFYIDFRYGSTVGEFNWEFAYVVFQT